MNIPNRRECAHECGGLRFGGGVQIYVVACGVAEASPQARVLDQPAERRYPLRVRRGEEAIRSRTDRLTERPRRRRYRRDADRACLEILDLALSIREGIAPERR